MSENGGETSNGGNRERLALGGLTRSPGNGLSFSFDGIGQGSNPRNDFNLQMDGMANRTNLALNFNEMSLSKPKLPSPSFSEANNAFSLHLLQSKNSIGTLTIRGEKFSYCAEDLIDLGEIGRGNFGSVSKMRHEISNTEMAVKRIRSTVDEKEQKQLLKELDIVMKSGNCPYIVQFYGASFKEGDCWICMELMSTSVEKLYKIVHHQLHESIPEDILGRIALCVVKAMDYLKQNLKIIHRDIKPSNMLVDVDGSIKLCDFGISGHLVDSIARTRDAGCQPYMAPERIDPFTAKHGYDIRSDVWSLGISLIEIAIGKFPFTKWNNIFDQLSQVVNGNPPQLVNGGSVCFSEDCLNFVNSCLTKDVEGRPKYKDLLMHVFLRTNEEKSVDVAGWMKRITEEGEKIPDALSLSVHDPRLSPGHLQPLGSGRPKTPVEVVLQYPSPEDFFTNYVDKKVPFIIRGAAKALPAFAKWSESYFRSDPEIAKLKVSVDSDKKQLDNISNFRHMPFTTFLDRFKEEELFLVDGIKAPLQRDVLLPACLRCEETRKELQDTAMWFSSGETRSLLSLTFRDEIVCVIRGSNQYLLLPFMKYRNKFKKLMGDESMRKIDVDRVDFGKYPELEEVEWVTAYIDQGDCLYIPYKWANQVNSYAGKTRESLFLTFSFTHIHDHRPKKCKIAPNKATLDKYQFSQLIEEQMRTDEMEALHSHGNETGNGNDEHEHDVQDYMIKDSEQQGLLYFKRFRSYLKKKQSKTLNFNQFLENIKSDNNVFDKSVANYKLPESFDKLVREIFNLLDTNNDHLLSYVDFKNIKKSKRFEEILSDLDWHTYGLHGYVDDYMESSHHGVSDEEFDANRRARELRKKLSIHDPMEL
eukprot:gene9009-9973_t